MKTLIMCFVIVLLLIESSSVAQVRRPTRRQVEIDSTNRIAKQIPLDPNRTRQEILLSRYKLSKEVSELLIRGRPYRSPVEVFKLQSLVQKATFKELATIMAGSRATLPFTPSLPIANRIIYGKSRLLLYGMKIDVSGRSRYFISDTLNNEIISADQGSDKTIRIDLATVKIFQNHPWDYSSMLTKQWRPLFEILEGAVGKDAMALWQELEPKEKADSALVPVSALSQLLMTVKEISMVEDCTTSNGCSFAPDFNFKECCDEHDMCYCRGGAADAQQKCDAALSDCIKQKGHDVLAAIYAFMGGTFGGAAHMGPTIYQDDSPATSTSTTPNTGPANCRITVSVVSVEYGGDYIGNDWTYTVSVDGQSTRLLHDGTHNHHATRSYGKVYEKLRSGACGNTFNVILSANAREEDSLDDDKGSASVSKSITCTAGEVKTYDKMLTVSVKEAINFWPDDHGKMFFLFRITTKCE